MGLSSKFPFLFALTASICLVYLLNRFLKSGAGRIKWLGNILLTAVFFALFQHHWWIRLPRSVYYLFPVLEAIPVSYTHLDVYKRQGGCLPASFAKK